MKPATKAEAQILKKRKYEPGQQANTMGLQAQEDLIHIEDMLEEKEYVKEQDSKITSFFDIFIKLNLIKYVKFKYYSQILD